MRSATTLLIAVLVCTGGLIAARALFGPFTIPLHVNSPLNLEGSFGLAAILLLLLRAVPVQDDRARLRLGWPDALAGAAVFVIVGAAFWRSAHDYFLSDDFVIIGHAQAFRFGLRQMFATRGGDGFFRPFTYASYALSIPWTGLDPFRWHLIGFALHAVSSAVVAVLARQLGCSRALAWFAGVLFAIHGSRPETVLWITGRFDLLSTLFVLLALVLFCAEHRWWAVGAMVCGILCKESAYACPLLMALLVWARGDDTTWQRRVRIIAPFFIAAGLLFAYRFVLYHGIGGYVTSTGQPQVLDVRVVPMLNALAVRLWATLFFSVNWAVAHGPLFGAAIALYIAGMVWLTFSRARRRDILIGAGFVLIAALPPVQQLLIGADLLKARYLYMPSIGFCLLIAHAAAGLRPSARWVVCSAVIAFNVVALGWNLSAWNYAARRTEPVCVAAASCVRGPQDRILAVGLPRILNGTYFFQNGFPECTRLQAGSPVNAEVQDTVPANLSPYSCVLTWDPSVDQVRLHTRPSTSSR